MILPESKAQRLREEKQERINKKIGEPTQILQNNSDNGTNQRGLKKLFRRTSRN